MQLLDLADSYKEYSDKLGELEQLLEKIKEESQTMCKGV